MNKDGKTGRQARKMSMMMHTWGQRSDSF